MLNSTQERAKLLRKHRKAIREMRSCIDTKVPATLSRPHSKGSAKKKFLQRERQEQIQRDNLLLADRMHGIIVSDGPISKMVRAHGGGPRSLNIDSRMREVRRIEHDNQVLLDRLEHVQPYYNHSKGGRRSHSRRRAGAAQTAGATTGGVADGLPSTRNARDTTALADELLFGMDTGAEGIDGGAVASPSGNTNQMNNAANGAAGAPLTSRSDVGQARPELTEKDSDGGILLQYTKQQNDRLLDVVVSKTPQGTFTIDGTDVSSGRLFQREMSENEVISAVEGDVLVTSLEHIEVWIALVNKINLPEVADAADSTGSAGAAVARSDGGAGGNAAGADATGKLRIVGSRVPAGQARRQSTIVGSRTIYKEGLRIGSGHYVTLRVRPVQDPDGVHSNATAEGLAAEVAAAAKEQEQQEQRQQEQSASAPESADTPLEESVVEEVAEESVADGAVTAKSDEVAKVAEDPRAAEPTAAPTAATAEENEQEKEFDFESMPFVVAFAYDATTCVEYSVLLPAKEAKRCHALISGGDAGVKDKDQETGKSNAGESSLSWSSGDLWTSIAACLFLESPQQTRQVTKPQSMAQTSSSVSNNTPPDPTASQTILVLREPVSTDARGGSPRKRRKGRGRRRDGRPTMKELLAERQAQTRSVYSASLKKPVVIDAAASSPGAESPRQRRVNAFAVEDPSTTVALPPEDLGIDLDLGERPHAPSGPPATGGGMSPILPSSPSGGAQAGTGVTPHRPDQPAPSRTRPRGTRDPAADDAAARDRAKAEAEAAAAEAAAQRERERQAREEAEKATHIQAVFRGHQARRDSADQAEAAQKIQAVARGKRARAEYVEKKKELIEEDPTPDRFMRDEAVEEEIVDFE